MIKICVIGNSHLGAVVTAYKQFGLKPATVPARIARFPKLLTSGRRSIFGGEKPSAIQGELKLDFTFMGAAWPEFDSISTDGTRITGDRFCDRDASHKLADYDAFLIYGGLNCAQHIAHFDSEMMASGYSQAVRTASLIERIRRSVAVKLCNSIYKASAKKIFVLSNNPLLDLPVLNDTAIFVRAEEILRSALEPYQLISFPEALLGPGFVPKQEYYKDSLYIDGRTRDVDFEFHDNEHMNVLGGRLVLDRIAATLARSFDRGET